MIEVTQKVKLIEGNRVVLYKKNGKTWDCGICTRCKLRVEEFIDALKHGGEVEADVEMPKNHPAVVVSFKHVEQETESSLEEQEEEYLLGGDY